MARKEVVTCDGCGATVPHAIQITASKPTRRMFTVYRRRRGSRKTVSRRAPRRSYRDLDLCTACVPPILAAAFRRRAREDEDG